MELWQSALIGAYMGGTFFLLYLIQQQLALKNIRNTTKLPLVHEFWSIEGLTEYCRKYLPNCYDKLCVFRESEVWQARFMYSALITKKEPYVEDYLRALALVAHGEDLSYVSAYHSRLLRRLEDSMAGLVEPPDKAQGYSPELANELMPVSKEFLEKFRED